MCHNIFSIPFRCFPFIKQTKRKKTNNSYTDVLTYAETFPYNKNYNYTHTLQTHRHTSVFTSSWPVRNARMSPSGSLSWRRMTRSTVAAT